MDNNNTDPLFDDLYTEINEEINAEIIFHKNILPRETSATRRLFSVDEAQDILSGAYQPPNVAETLILVISHLVVIHL